MPREGRDLEHLVHALERCWSPAEAEIKSPDYLPDLVTGQKREVDGSIRYKLGTVPILVILECRDRATVEDTTWIEQLSQKRKDVGASRAVAVSSRGFTGPATIKAAHHGIELRTVSTITPEAVAHWCAATTITTFSHRADIQRVSVGISPLADATRPEVQAEFMALFGTPDLFRPVFKVKRTGELVSVANVWEALSSTHKFFDSIPNDGTRHQRTFEFNFIKPEERYVLTICGDEVDVEQLRIIATLWFENTEEPATSFYTYGSPSSPEIEAVEYQFFSEGAKYILTVQKNRSRPGLAAVLRKDASN